MHPTLRGQTFLVFVMEQLQQSCIVSHLFQCCIRQFMVNHLPPLVVKQLGEAFLVELSLGASFVFATQGQLVITCLLRLQRKSAGVHSPS